MSPDPLLPPDDPTPAPSPTPAPVDPPVAKNRITCDFCRCVLVPASGDVLRMSPEAKTMRDNADTIETLRRDLSETQSLLATARQEAATALQEVERLNRQQQDSGSSLFRR